MLDDRCYLSSSNISPCVVPFLSTWWSWESWLIPCATKDCTAIFSEFVCILHTYSCTVSAPEYSELVVLVLEIPPIWHKDQDEITFIAMKLTICVSMRSCCHEYMPIYNQSHT